MVEEEEEEEEGGSRKGGGAAGTHSRPCNTAWLVLWRRPLCLSLSARVLG